MRVVLFILCVFAFLGGVSVLVGAQSAIHEIEAFMLFLIGAVFLVGASMMETLGVTNRNLERIKDHLRTGIKALDAKLIAIARLLDSKESSKLPKTESVPTTVKGTCKLCGGVLEFDSKHLGETASCPHCGQETGLETTL